MFKFVYCVSRSLYNTRRLLYDEVKPLLTIKCYNVEKVISCLLFNTAASCGRGRNTFHVPLNKNKYNYNIVNGSKVKVPFSHKTMINVLDVLIDLDYITITKGEATFKYDPIDKHNGGSGLVIDSVTYSTITMTDKLTNLLPVTKQVDKSFSKVDNVIILRDSNKKDVEFHMPKFIKGKKKSLDDYNDKARYVEVRSPEGIMYDCQLRKIYNSLFNIGGRSYMVVNSVQDLSKEQRRMLTIDGRETVIYDYVAFEVAIAYTMAGSKVEGDPYAKVVLEGYPPEMSRNINKIALTILLNCEMDDIAAHAISHELAKQYDIRKLYEEGIIPDKVVPVRQLLILLEDAHTDIEPYFYGGKCSGLSNIGSEIMDYIVDFFLQRGEVVLPVFDEVICPEGFENELIMAMGDAWEDVLGSRDNVNIRKEK